MVLRLIEYFHPIPLAAGAAFLLQVLWQMGFLPAGRAAAAFMFFGAFRALDEEQVAAVVLTVSMGIAGNTALVAVGDDIFRDALAEPVVEDEVLADELQRQPLLAGAAGVLDDAAFELEHIHKAVVQQ